MARSIHEMLLRNMDIYQLKITLMDLKVPGFQEMGTLRCEGCGEEFVVGHQPAFVDKKIAERQAASLEKVLAEEHERDKKNPDRIELPD